jgi:hypothetical protein
MSIPERLYRLAKGKIGEIREMFDGQESDDIDPELLARVQRAQAHKTARQELQDALEGEPGIQAAHAAPPRRSSSPTLRSPDEIRGAATGTAGTMHGSVAASVAPATQDPLAIHYKLLGLEPGADYATVQAVYEKLLSRCQPDRFPAGSPEAVEAHDIQNRLEASYKVLREALDPTARRFDMLEI